MRADFVAGGNHTLKVTLREAQTGALKDLSNKTCKLRWEIEGAGPVERSMTILDAVNGLCEYTFGDSELSEGSMRARVHVVDSISGAEIPAPSAEMVFKIARAI